MKVQEKNRTTNKKLDKEVVAQDVLNIFRNINSMEDVSEDVIDLEKKILINSFCKNEELFCSKVIYYDFATLMIHIGKITNDADKINKTNNILDSILKILFNIDELTLDDRIEVFSIVCSNYEMLYQKVVNLNEKSISYKDIFTCIVESLKKYEITKTQGFAKRINYKIS